MTDWDDRTKTYTNPWELDTPDGQADYVRLHQIFRRHAIAAPAEHILDVACGKPAILPLLLEHIGPKGHVVSLDASYAMLLGARQKGATTQNCLVQGDGLRLPFVAGIFDGVILFNALPHFENQVGLFKEAARVLKAGGHLTIMHSLNRRDLDALHRQQGFDMRQATLPTAAMFEGWLMQSGLTFDELIDSDGSDYFLLTALRA